MIDQYLHIFDHITRSRKYNSDLREARNNLRISWRGAPFEPKPFLKICSVGNGTILSRQESKDQLEIRAEQARMIAQNRWAAEFKEIMGRYDPNHLETRDLRYGFIH